MSERGRPLRIVVCAPRGNRGLLELPESTVGSDPEYISGGERSLYELATAAACLGHDVELRGGLNASILATITDAAGASPRVRLGPRRPEAGEVVIMPEALDTEIMCSVHLSGALGVVMTLAPPGLWGWSFRSGWKPPDATSVPLDEIGTPATFRAIDALGLVMWTNAHGVAAAGHAAGVAVRWIGTGTPVPFVEPADKTVDIAIIEGNRWFDPALEVSKRISGASILRVPPIPSTYSLSEALAPARILLWPSRVEGMSRIARESRAVGTVPVALDTNPFVTGDDHGQGVVLVPDQDAMVDEVNRLLRDTDTLCRLSTMGRASAQAQTDWVAFLERVEEAVTELPSRPDDEAREEFGDIVGARTMHLLHEQEALAQERLDQAERSKMHAEEAASDLRVALGQTAEDLLRAQRELDAFRARRILRLVDGSPLRLAARLVRSKK